MCAAGPLLILLLHLTGLFDLYSIIPLVFLNALEIHYGPHAVQILTLLMKGFLSAVVAADLYFFSAGRYRVLVDADSAPQGAETGADRALWFAFKQFLMLYHVVGFPLILPLIFRYLLDEQVLPAAYQLPRLAGVSEYSPPVFAATAIFLVLVAYLAMVLVGPICGVWQRGKIRPSASSKIAGYLRPALGSLLALIVFLSLFLLFHDFSVGVLFFFMILVAYLSVFGIFILFIVLPWGIFIKVRDKIHMKDEA